MSEHDGLANFVHREVQRVLHRTTRRTPAVVDSYDPKTHAVKVKLMPDSVSDPVVTGWLPLHTQQTGNGFGWHMPPNIGDHVWIEFHDDDREAGQVAVATFNDQLKPNQNVQAGEWFYQTKFGQQIYFKNDGTVTIKDKGGNSIVMNGSDTITLNASNIVLNGTVKLGGSDANTPAAMQGSTDTHGDAVVGNLAKKVLVK